MAQQNPHLFAHCNGLDGQRLDDKSRMMREHHVRIRERPRVKLPRPTRQFFCGEEFFQHRLVFDRSSLTRWRQRMGEEKLQALIQESLSVATRTDAIKPSELSRVIVDTTVQPKNVMFPTDAKLLNRAREILVRLAGKHGVDLRQSYVRVGKYA